MTCFRDLVLVLAAAAVLAAAGATQASAAYPGPNGRIFFTALAPGAAAADVWSIEPDGTDAVNLTDLPGGPGEGHDPSVSANGSQLAFVAGAGAAAEIWTMTADGSATRPVTANAFLDQMPSLSADGSRIAFVSARDPGLGDLDIWTMSADGSGQALLLDGPGPDLYPQFHPDGEHLVMASESGGDLDIAYVSAGGGPDAAPTVVTEFSDLDIWTMSADGSGQALLVDGPGPELYPQFHPDGEHLVMASESGGDLDIAYVSAGGGPDAAPTVVTEFSDLDQSMPAIKPDGSRVAYSESSGGGQSDIYDVFFNGTDFLAVAADPAVDETAPAYSPDGTEIVYATAAGLVVAAAGGGDPQPLDTAPAAAPTDPDWAVGRAPDRTPPQTRITKAPEDGPARQAAFRFSSSEAGSSFECRLDRGRFAACASPRRYRGLGAGDHRFRVHATDAAGNTDPSPARASFSVERRR